MKSKTTGSWRKALAVLFTALLIVSTFSIISATTSAAGTDVPEKFDNPVIKTDADGNIFFSADPSVRNFDGKLYMYCSHDIFPAQRCDKMDKYHVFSSTNGQDWTDEGEILSAADVGWGEPSGFMWAPDCEKIGDKYYFFYPHKLVDGDWQTGVAISDTPVGPFKDLGPIEGTKGPGMIDPNIFVDDDGKAYLYWGGSQKLFAAELTVSGESVTLGTTKDMTGYCDKFHEGSWIFKKDGKYYMTYASSDADDGHILAYSVGDSPLGEYTYKGTMLSANEVYMDTSHGSVVEYDGQWLIFYHNMALSGFECLRSVCADHLNFNADGTIVTVTPSKNTAPPVNKTEPTNATMYPVNEDWTIGADDSVDADGMPFLNKNNPDNMFVQNMHVKGAYYELATVDGGEGGKAKLHFRYSSFNEYSAICVNVNGVDYDPAPAAPNGEWEDFTNYTSTTVMLNKGMNTVRITGGYGGVNVSAMYVELLGGSIDNPTDGGNTPTGATPTDGTPIATDNGGNPVATDNGGNVVTTANNPLPTDNGGNIVATDNGGNVIIATDNGGNVQPTAGGNVTPGGNSNNPKTDAGNTALAVVVAAVSAAGLMIISRKRSK